MSTVADYQGRTADLLMLQGDYSGRGDRLLVQSLVGPAALGGAVVTGIQKLVQRVLLALLTRAGTMRYRPAAGTTFLSDAQAGIWRTAADVELSFNSCRLDLVRQVRAEERDDDPADERLDGVDLLDASFTAGDAVVRALVTSDAGSSYVFVAPVPVVVR